MKTIVTKKSVASKQLGTQKSAELPLKTSVVKKISVKKIDITPPISSAATEIKISKQAQLITLLSSPNGSDIKELMQVTGWRAHSIRGVISGVLKKRLGLPVISEKIEGSQRYRIATI